MREMFSLFALTTPIDEATVWGRWFRFCMEQEQRHGFTSTHLCCTTEHLNPRGIRTRSRYLKKIEAALEAGERISNIEFYLLPKEFRQAVFDFRVYMGLSRRNCEITVERSLWEEFDHEALLAELRTFLNITRAEVNLLPYNEVFNYNFNCILSPSKEPGDYPVIQNLHKEP